MHKDLLLNISGGVSFLARLRGRRRKWDDDDVRLCAQALCLEEMLGVEAPAGAIFHVNSKRRREVVFDPPLRQKTEQAARRLHELFAAGVTPPAVLKPRCRGCSLKELCLPELLATQERTARYARRLYQIEENVRVKRRVGFPFGKERLLRGAGRAVYAPRSPPAVLARRLTDGANNAASTGSRARFRVFVRGREPPRRDGVAAWGGSSPNREAS